MKRTSLFVVFALLGVPLQAASEWAFNRESPEQVTLSLLVLQRGELILERYADGVDMHTRTRTWSTAKSIAVTLIGMLWPRFGPVIMGQG